MQYRVGLETGNYICPEVQLLAIRQSVRKPCFSLGGFPPGLLPKLNGILQGRGQTAEEIARAALFLCSHQSSAMTGQSMYVDGGVAFS
jgi:NAD(P)-dependent dehydrogenase (short-subunit alcohol dehydrogenase family)